MDIINRLGERQSFFRALACQDTGSPHSKTYRLVGGVLGWDIVKSKNPRRFEPGAEDFLSRQVGALLDWAYGFHAPRPGRSIARNAPSAGALYPTECICQFGQKNGRRSYIYDFKSAEFLEIPNVKAGGTLPLTTEEEDSVEILLVSDAWRSIQRYGFRGYRYCLLDAAAVLSNLVILCEDWGLEVSLGPFNLLSNLTQKLDIPAAVLPIAVITVSGFRAKGANIQEYTFSTSKFPPYLFFEERPRMNPQLVRVMSFHKKALDGNDALAKKPHSEAREIRENRRFEVERASASFFSGNRLDDFVENSIVEYIKRYVKYESKNNYFSIVVFFVKKNKGDEIEIRRIDNDVDQTIAQINRSYKDISTSIFQAQKIVAESSLLLVIGVRASELYPRPYELYLNSCLRAGYLMQDIYRYCALNNISNTAVGGFSDFELSNLLFAKDYQPLVAHAFGVEADGVKIDASSRERGA